MLFSQQGHFFQKNEAKGRAPYRKLALCLMAKTKKQELLGQETELLFKCYCKFIFTIFAGCKLIFDSLKSLDGNGYIF